MSACSFASTYIHTSLLYKKVMLYSLMTLCCCFTQDMSLHSAPSATLTALAAKSTAGWLMTCRACYNTPNPERTVIMYTVTCSLSTIPYLDRNVF